jgi:glycosyltransferase involved in cell wall biosynthesis
MRLDPMRLLLVSDFACSTGLARVAESLAAGLADLGWEIAVLACNYHGDAHPLQQRYRLYPADGGGDAIGVGRIAALTQHVRPDAILTIHDAWNVRDLLAELYPPAPPLKGGTKIPPVVAYVPVDGTAMRERDVAPMNCCAHVVAYTQFGKTQLRLAGLDAPCSIIPHGIDRDVFRPIAQYAARQVAGLSPDVYAVLVLAANQPRKRLDIAFDAFARFAADKHANVVLVYHGPLSTRNGWDIEAMADDLGIAERLIVSSRNVTPTRGVGVDRMAVLYSMCDCKVSTTSGEGWDLTTMEAMACGLPCVVPDFAALGEWASGAALLVNAPIPVRHCGGINTVGRVPKACDVADSLRLLYDHPDERRSLRQDGLALVAEPRYRWEAIAAQFDQVLRSVAPSRSIAAPAPLEASYA